MTISVRKTKLLVAGSNITQADLDTIRIGESTVETVSSFCYLGSVVDCHGSMNAELTARVARAAAVFGVLRRSVFCDSLLSLQTKRMVYQAVMLGVLLYAVETWPIKQRDVHSLEVFHYRCLRTILGVSRSR